MISVGILIMHDFEVTGYELISKDGEKHFNVCYGCYEEKITELREKHNIEHEFPIFYSDETTSIFTCEFCQEPIEQKLIKRVKPY